MNKWIEGEVISIKHWTKKLFSLIIKAKINSFIAGQFTKIKLNINGKYIKRAYSYVNSPKNKNLEFYIITSSKGKLSKKLYLLKKKDIILISKESFGILTINNIPNYCKDLWMLATGTGIGPYLSILENKKGLKKFKKIILIHSIKYYKDLIYLSKIKKLKKYYKNKLKIEILISREKKKYSIKNRIPNLIKNGYLEKKLNTYININKSYIMICGNPKMVFDTKKILINKYKMKENFKNNIGNFIYEKYW